MPSRSTSGSRPSAGRPMARRTTRATCMRCRLFHAELPGLPAAGLRIPAQQRRAAPARARHLRDPRPRLRRRPGIARAVVSANDWIVTLDVSADEYLGRSRSSARWCATTEGRAHGRRPRAQPVRPGAGLLCGAPQRIERPELRRARQARHARQPSAPLQGKHPMKRLIPSALAGMLLAWAACPRTHAVEILRWERCRWPCRWWSARSAWCSSTATCASACRQASANACACRARAARSTCARASRSQPTRLQLQDVESRAR
jgi:hypothetical protein